MLLIVREDTEVGQRETLRGAEEEDMTAQHLHNVIIIQSAHVDAGVGVLLTQNPQRSLR